jgi:HTH-like domain
MTYPLVQELAAEGIPVTVTCGVLGFSTQAFYKWAAAPICQRDLDEAHLVNAIVDIHADDPEFGYRFISDELERAGHEVGERRVQRLCTEHKIWSTTTKKGRKNHKTAGPAVHDDLVNRDFSAPAPNITWLTDITEHPSRFGGQALRLLHQRRLLQSHRRLRRRRSDDRRSGSSGSALGRRSTPTSRDRDCSFGQGRPISIQKIPSCAQGPQAHRLDGSSLFSRGQRSNGILLLFAAKERAEPPALAHP